MSSSSPKVLTSEELKTFLQKYPDWKYKEQYLERSFPLKSYFKGLSFLQSIGWLAQKHQHHPDIMLTFSELKLRLTTHDSGNSITLKDTHFAEVVEQLWF